MHFMADKITETDPKEAAKQVIPLLDEISPSMCMAKWLWSSIHLTTGQTNSCFLPPLHKIDVKDITDNPKGLHNTPQKKEQRAMMLKGEKPKGCATCWKMEEQGSLSDRFYRSSEPWAQKGWDDVIATGSQGDIEPRYLEVNFNHACNLACSYCSPHLSSKWAEDIEKDGPYNTIVPHNDINYFKSIGQYPIPVREENPYVEAFWKWWPDLYPKLESFRMTGGEPLMDKNTFKVLDYIIENPRPDLEVAVTTNASVPEKLWNKFIDKVSYITNNNMVKRFRLFVSVDGYGEQAEYMRDGLEFNRLWNNVHNYLRRTDSGLVTFICTFNMLSVPTLKQLMQGIIDLQKVHNVKSSDKERVYGYHRVFVDTPPLYFPIWQSIKLVPKDMWPIADEVLEYMKQNTDKQIESRWVGFKPHQIDRFERALLHMKQSFDETQQAEAEENFVRFFQDYDRRRNRNFCKTFPQYAKLFTDWSKKYGIS